MTWPDPPSPTAIHEQHTVSQVVLRSWAIGNHIARFDLRARRPKARPVGIAKTGYLFDFVRFGAAETEARFQKIENRARNAIDLAVSGSLPDGDPAIDDLRDLLVLHAVRSRSTHAFWGRLAEGPAIPDKVAALKATIGDPQVQQAIAATVTSFPLPPSAAQELGRDTLTRHFDEHLGMGGVAFAKHLVRILDTNLARLAGVAIEIGVSAGELIISDDPAPPIDAAGNFGILSGVTIDNAATVAMPIGPHHMIGLANEFRYVDLSPDEADFYNRIQWHSAHQLVMATPTPAGSAAVADLHENHPRNVPSPPQTTGRQANSK